MKKFLTLTILSCFLLSYVPVCAAEVYTKTLGPSITPEQLKYQHIPPEMSGERFLTSYLYEYDELTEELKTTFENITPTIDVSSYYSSSVNLEDVSDDIEASIYEIQADNPYLFYIEKWSIQKYGSVITVTFTYSDTKEALLQINADTEAKIQSVCEDVILSSMTDLQKELAIHDYLTDTCWYDLENYNNGTVPSISHSAYGVLILNIAVCDGYARAMQLFMNYLNIPCILVASEAINHAWNMINIDGSNYHVDVTWDDTDSNIYRCYTYFNVDDTTFKIEIKNENNEIIKSAHVWVYDDFTSCDDQSFSYIYNLSEYSFPQNDNEFFYYSNYDPAADATLIKMNVQNGETETMDNSRSYYITLYNGVLYYLNYSKGGYLYSMLTDGTNNIRINNIYSQDLYIENEVLYYTLYDTTEQHSISLAIPSPPEEYIPSVLNVEYAYFADQSGFAKTKISTLQSVFAKFKLTNKQSTQLPCKVFAVTYSDGILTNASVLTLNLDGGEAYEGNLVLDTSCADEADFFVLYNFSPAMSAVTIEK